MKQAVEEMIRQVLIDLAINQIPHLIDWLNTVPWRVWFV